MRPGGGKIKGGAFEREVCEKLSLWVSAGKYHDLFWRSAMSGGRATVGRRAGKSVSRQAGDISAVAPEGHALTNLFFIECKSYKELNVRGFVLDNKGTLANFWQETVEQARQHGRAPVLIGKENFRKEILLVQPSDWYKLAGDVIQPLVVVRAPPSPVAVAYFATILNRPYTWLQNEPSPLHHS
jgi:hypothetical protein